MKSLQSNLRQDVISRCKQLDKGRSTNVNNEEDVATNTSYVIDVFEPVHF